MNIRDTIAAYGTSEGAEKAWDTRGRGRKQRPLSDRAQRAIASYNPSTHAKRVIAYDVQNKVAKALGSQSTPDHLPFDIIKGNVGVEVKALIDRIRDDITMHPPSLRRKIDYAKEHYLKRMYTIVVDLRGGSEKVYYKKGVGSFRLNSMERLSGLSELKRVIK